MSAEITYRPRGREVHNDAIISPPIKVAGYVPVEKQRNRMGREGTGKIIPNVQTLRSDPGFWYKVGLGKKQTLSQMQLRMLAQENSLIFDKREEVGEDGSVMALYAQYPGFGIPK